MVQLGSENETTEFKKDLGQLDKGILSLTAMINRHNRGTVYFGVDDDGTVVGVKPASNHLEKIRNNIRSSVFPQILVDISILETPEGLKYIRVFATGQDTPYSYDGRYYVRNVSSNEQASPNLVRKMMMCGNCDIIRGIRSPIQELTFSSYMAYLESKNLHPKMTRDYFEGRGMMTESREYNLIAYLMSDQNDVAMQVVRFNGKTKASMSERTDYGHRCLLVTVRAVLNSISTMNETRVKLSKGEREETDLFDTEVFRESWINACVHNYWKDMLPPSVFIFDDRIEVQSYGGIPFSLSKDEFYSGKSMPINRSLFDIFTLVDYSEQSGHGVPTIVERYGKSAITIGDTIITVTIPFAFVPRWVVSAQYNVGIPELTDKEVAILEYLSDNPTTSIKDAAQSLGVGISTLGKVVSRLKVDGFLSNAGTNRNNRWVRLRRFLERLLSLEVRNPIGIHIRRMKNRGEVRVFSGALTRPGDQLIRLAALSSAAILSTARVTSSGTLAPVQTIFPDPKSRTTTLGSSSL